MKYFIITLTLFVILISGCLENQQEIFTNDKLFDEYGIELSKYKSQADSIEANDNIYSVLADANIEMKSMRAILDSSKNIYDLSLIKQGHKILSYYSLSGDSSLKYFIYEINPIEYCLIDLTNGIKVSRKEKETFLLERTAYGKITSSLYQTLSDANISPELAVKLAEIFAWEIDFYRLQKEDYFKVVFEEIYVSGKFAGISKISAAEFFHDGESYFAFGFSQDDQWQYFNEEGKSLRKQFLQSPLKFSRITSGFSLKRFHPVQKKYKAHLGTDYAAPTGTPILAVGDGIVIEAAYKQFNGNYVKIRHNATYTTQYLHMSRFAKGIKRGAHVSQGQVIGYVGSTGLATGPHVCFRFWKNNQQVDHRKEKFPPSYPVAEKIFTEFLKVKDLYSSKLNIINIESSPVQFASR
ncbi:MAG: peptidoglycan DD-metalloendopeptidase family protein [Ignavibacteriales bacterium]